MTDRRLPARGSRPTGLRPKPQRSTSDFPTADLLLANLPARVRNHPGFNQTTLEKTAAYTLARVQTCSSPDHGQGDIAFQIADAVVRDLAPSCTQSPAGAAPGSGLAVGFLFEGIALYLLRAFAELAARQMLKWAWGWIQRTHVSHA